MRDERRAEICCDEAAAAVARSGGQRGDRVVHCSCRRCRTGRTAQRLQSPLLHSGPCRRHVAATSAHFLRQIEMESE